MIDRHIDDVPSLVTALREWEPIMHRAADLIERLDRSSAALAKQLSQALGRNARSAKLLSAATVSASGLDITIACNDHDTKDALLELLTS